MSSQLHPFQVYFFFLGFQNESAWLQGLSEEQVAIDTISNTHPTPNVNLGV